MAMPNRIAALVLLALLAFAPAQAQAKAVAAAAAPAPSGTQVVQNFYDALMATMKEGEKLGFDGRYRKLEPAISSAFNLPLMAKVAIGMYWNKAKEEERRKMVELFSAFSTSNYASRFKKFDGEFFTVYDEKEIPGGVMVETTITPRGQKPVALNYLLRKDEAGSFKIVDVYMDSAISELATRRAEFTSVIKREGLGTFLRNLESSTDRMSATR